MVVSASTLVSLRRGSIPQKALPDAIRDSRIAVEFPRLRSLGSRSTTWPTRMTLGSPPVWELRHPPRDRLWPVGKQRVDLPHVRRAREPGDCLSLGRLGRRRTRMALLASPDVGIRGHAFLITIRFARVKSQSDRKKSLTESLSIEIRLSGYRKPNVTEPDAAAPTAQIARSTMLLQLRKVTPDGAPSGNLPEISAQRRPE